MQLDYVYLASLVTGFGATTVPLLLNFTLLLIKKNTDLHAVSSKIESLRRMRCKRLIFGHIKILTACRKRRYLSRGCTRSTSVFVPRC